MIASDSLLGAPRCRASCLACAMHVPLTVCKGTSRSFDSFSERSVWIPSGFGLGMPPCTVWGVPLGSGYSPFRCRVSYLAECGAVSSGAGVSAYRTLVLSQASASCLPAAIVVACLPVRFGVCCPFPPCRWHSWLVSGCFPCAQGSRIANSVCD